MKTIMNRLFVVTSALAMVLCTSQCAKDKELGVDEKEMNYVTLTAHKGEMTKAELEESGVNMAVTWSTGDNLYVVGATDGLLGSVTLTSGAGAASAKFEGYVKYTTSKQDIHFYYVGKTSTVRSTTYALDLSSQAGTLDGIENTMHVMSGTVSNAAAGTADYGTVTMSNIISIVKVDTKAAFGEVSDIKLSGCISKGELNLKTGAVTPTNGDITLTGTASNDYYIALLADGTEQTFSFAFNDKSRYIDAKIIAKGKYYTANGNSVPLKYPFEFVDLDLPSGTLWANMNVGAETIIEDGDYYAWGMTEYYYNSLDPFVAKASKYSTGYSVLSYTGVDSTTNPFKEWTIPPYDETTGYLKPQYDVATQIIGQNSHTPSKTQAEELFEYTNHEFLTVEGKKVVKLSSKINSDNWIYLPAAGNLHRLLRGSHNVSAMLWTSYRDVSVSEKNRAYIFYYNVETQSYGTSHDSRVQGLPVRAVKETKINGATLPGDMTNVSGSW